MKHAGESLNATQGLAFPLQQVDRTYVWFGRRKLIYFGGCDYHRLSSHPLVLQAFWLGLEEFGMSVSASRRTTGNHRIYVELEALLAKHFAVPAATLTSNGYLTNLVVVEALRGDIDHVIIDARAHSSLALAASQAGCSVETFAHKDVDAVRHAASRVRKGRRMALLTDGLFAHDGSVAPLDEYDEVLPKSAIIIVDDAHGAGVLGQRGRGTVEYFGLKRRHVIQTVTLSKAFGAYGGAVLSNRGVARRMIGRSSVFAGATPFPLPFAAATLQSLKLIRGRDDFVNRLSANVHAVKEPLVRAGILESATPGPIVSITPRNKTHEVKLRRQLHRQGIYPSLIRYGAGPACGHFRFAISSEHSREQLERLVAALLF